MSNISTRIVYAREIRLLRQEDIAQKMGVCSETVTQWEIGMAEPTPEQIIKLGQILQVSPEWLYTGNLPFPQIFKTNRHPADRLFDEKEMYSFIRTYTLRRTHSLIYCVNLDILLRTG
jgi:transcriptional regulator with XRE-family HTH domain